MSKSRRAVRLAYLTSQANVLLTFSARTNDSYGFKHVYIPADVLAWDPSIWPFHKLTDKERTYIKVRSGAHLDAS